MEKNKIVWLYSLMVMGFIILLINGCENDQVPILTTNEVSAITNTTANSGGNITSDGGSKIDYRGVCWSKDRIPTITDNKIYNSTNTDNFTSVITDLIPSTFYYVRAFAHNINGIGYGTAISFFTSATPPVTDIDGNDYNTITIGTQTWMKENLKTTKYSDGSSIPNITDNTAWMAQTEGAYCWYENNIGNKNANGGLYNFYAVVDSRNLCPTGWHVPTDAEWTILEDNLGGSNVAGRKMRAITSWYSEPGKTYQSNESGFTALPGGCRGYYDTGNFSHNTVWGYWWSATESDPSNAYNRYLESIWPWISRGNNSKIWGISVRCIKD